MATNATSKKKPSAARPATGRTKAGPAKGGKSPVSGKPKAAASSRKSRKEKATVAQAANPPAGKASKSGAKPAAVPAAKEAGSAKPAPRKAPATQPKANAKPKPKPKAKSKPKAKAKPKPSAPAAAAKPSSARRPSTGGPVRVLAAHRDVGALRQIREAVTGHFDAEIDTSPLAERAFELALQRDYQLFFLDADLAEIRGELLYEMIEKAYRYAGQPRFAPAVAYIFDSSDSEKDKELRRDARVKGVLAQPLREDKIAEVCREVLPVRS